MDSEETRAYGHSVHGEDRLSSKSMVDPAAVSSPKKKTHFVGIHLGAGHHPKKLHRAYKRLCKAACHAGIRILSNGGSADEAVTAATVVLENSELVNAGKGSNLTLDEKVECDAGWMNGLGNFGGVGAVGGVPNPILICQKIAEMQTADYKLSGGRVPPTLLVGSGARKWAEAQSIPTCQPESLISKKASKCYAKYMKKVSDTTKKTSIDPSGVSDTIGVIALDHRDNVAATVSSGGNWLKFPGRVGHAPLFGAGCWAMNYGLLSDISVAVSTTGVGEMLSKVQWAALCGNLLKDHRRFDTPVAAIYHAIKADFLESHFLSQHTEPKVVGMIGLTWDGHHGEFIWGHSSDAFVVAAAGTGFRHVKMIFSTMAPKKPNEGIKVEGIMI